jgi:hypothetical protein
VSKSVLVKLAEKLEKLSRELEAANRLLNAATAVLAESPKLPDQVRSYWRQRAIVLKNTPHLMRALAADLRGAHAHAINRFVPKYDFLRHMVFMLLEYVETSTKSPHYQEVADLLTHLSGADDPKLLTSSDALKALYLRSAIYRSNRTRPSKSKRLPSA